MTITFEFSSNHFTTNGSCNTIEVEIDVRATCEDDYSWEIESLYDKTSECERKFEDFHPDDASDIESLAESHAYDNSYKAYESYCEGLADAAYDAWKDRDYE